MYIGEPKKFNSNLTIDSPYETFAVGVALLFLSQETLSLMSKLTIFLFNAHLALITVDQFHQ